MSLLEIAGLSHAYGDKILYQNASFSLYKGEHLGVVGQNGAGKSTLINILTGKIIPDQGDVKWKKGIKIGYLDQYAAVDLSLSIMQYLKTAFDKLYQLEREVVQLYNRYSHNGSEELFDEASHIQSYLEAQGFYTLDVTIEKTVRGLGLDAIGVDHPLSQLSGGQRAKVILSKLLLEQPDVLLLDEPTNFLDKNHITWLADYLTKFPHAYVVVSHDFSFLDQISTCICDVEAGTLVKYHGSYSHFIQQKDHLREDYLHRYQAQQRMIQRTEEFIRKNIAGNNSKNAKGRRKQLGRLERILPPNSLSKPDFRFLQAEPVTQKALKTEALEVGYQTPLLPKLSLVVSGKEKLVITGFNGIGKSTLLKTLMGEINRLSGYFTFSEQARIGYYEQELHWENPAITPVQMLRETFPTMNDKQIRSHLARCGIKNDSVNQAVSTLSGGEQSKVKLCKLLIKPYNVLILDEPTNHMDDGAKVALQRALGAFEGCILLVSHEERFYQSFADRVFNIEEQSYQEV